MIDLSKEQFESVWVYSFYVSYIGFIYSNKMEQSSVYRQTIDPFYKQGNVFERDEAYYTQMLSGTRRVANNVQGSLRQSSLQKSQSRLSPNPIRPSDSKVIPSSTVLLPPQPTASMHLQANSQAYNEALEENRALRREMDLQINGSSDFGNSSNVVVLQHYARSQQEAAILREQEEKIRQLEEVVRTNDAKINTYKKGAEELQLRINNIQAVDREIYKALQGSVNRDRELLDKAAAALARGQRREEVAKILQQIISP